MLLQRLGRAQRHARTAQGHLRSRQLLPSPSGRKPGLSEGFVLPLHSPGAQDPGSCQQPVPSPILVKLRHGGASSYQFCLDFNSKGQRLVPSVCLAKGWSVCLSVSARVPAFRGQRQDSASQSLGRSASSCHPFAHPQKHPSIPGLLTPLAVSAAKTWAWLRTPVAFSKTPQ